jgi:hypothetical protein
MSTLLKKPKSNSHDINIYFAKVNNINKSDDVKSVNESDNVIINKYESGKHETGKHETGKHETGKHETGKHETGKHETGKHETGKHESSKLPDKLMCYIEQLNPIEKIVLKIAQEHLETSFNLEKSIGYEQWIKSQQSPPPPP